MTNRSIEMFQLTIPIQKKVKHLSDEDRYTYYMLGHIFNELMSLQKLVGFALPKHNDMRPSRLKPELSQALFLFRLACSKIWEATITLRKKEVSNTLRTLILPKMQDGAERWKTLNRAINEAKWLSELRNRLGFHFPTFEEWKPFTTPNDD